MAKRDRDDRDDNNRDNNRGQRPARRLVKLNDHPGLVGDLIHMFFSTAFNDLGRAGYHMLPTVIQAKVQEVRDKAGNLATGAGINVVAAGILDLIQSLDVIPGPARRILVKGFEVGFEGVRMAITNDTIDETAATAALKKATDGMVEQLKQVKDKTWEELLSHLPTPDSDALEVLLVGLTSDERKHFKHFEQKIVARGVDGVGAINRYVASHARLPNNDTPANLAKPLPGVVLKQYLEGVYGAVPQSIVKTALDTVVGDGKELIASVNRHMRAPAPGQPDTVIHAIKGYNSGLNKRRGRHSV